MGNLFELENNFLKDLFDLTLTKENEHAINKCVLEVFAKKFETECLFISKTIIPTKEFRDVLFQFSFSKIKDVNFNKEKDELLIVVKKSKFTHRFVAGINFYAIRYGNYGYVTIGSYYTFSEESLSEIAFYLNLIAFHMENIITKIKKQAAESFFSKALRKLNLLEVFIDNSVDLVQVFDVFGNKVFYNKASSEALGIPYSKSNIYSISDVEPLFKNSKIWESHIERLKKEKNVKISSVIENVKTLEKVNIETAYSLVDFDNQEYILSIGRDITSQIEFQNKLFIEKKKAELADKAKDIFIANVSHEIRTPLNSIIGITNELERNSKNEENKQLIEFLKTSSNYLLTLIENILDLSKLTSGNYTLRNESFHFGKMLDNIKNILTPLCQFKNIDLAFYSSDEICPSFYNDESALKQVLLNILGNAIKFTEKGYVRLHVIMVEDDDFQQKIIFKISDTGIGIDEKFKKNIFNKFTQEHVDFTKEKSGNGLGMSITKEIVKLMNGRIELESEVGKGTEVEIELVLTKSFERDIKFDHLQFEKDSLRGTTIVVVDDNRVNSLVLKSALEHYGANVLQAFNGMECIELLTLNDSISLIMMDIEMPKMNGLVTANYIRNILKLDIPIIALTANSLNSQLDSYLKIGMNDVIKKPYTEHVVVSKIVKNINL
jgi:signal transduction histidine kinase/CheY-like chemotaxis protein